MSEEEIIKIIKEKIILDFNCYNPIDKIELQAIQGLLDLYNKEKEKNKELKKYKTYYETEKVVWNRKDYISKDKIKEVLGIEEDISEEKLLNLLETLMSEVDRLEDIEDKKVQIEYKLVFNKGVKSVEDKIIGKIEDLEKNNNGDDYNLINVINILKELLGKEE